MARIRTARMDTPTARRSDSKEMSDQQLVGFLGRKIDSAMNDEGGDLSGVRSKIFQRYYGEPYGTERDGYSKFTTREVLETVEWAMPALLRIFMGSERVVVFDAMNAEDEEAAAQETDVVNYKILKANGGDGFLALHDFIKDALMFPTSYIEADIEEETTSTTRFVSGVPAEGLAMLMEREGIEILEQDSKEIVVPMQQPHPQDPMQMITVPTPVEVFDLRYRETAKRKCLRITSVPGEECLVDKALTSLNLDHATFLARRVRKTFSELVAMGYDPDELDDVGTYDDHMWNDERTQRLFYEDEDPQAPEEEDESMRTFWVHKCYCWVDFEGTGVAQFRKIVMIGSSIFENEEVDYQPMTAMSSVLVPHKHNGLSIAQIVADLQELLTTLTRQLLDNIYRINIRRKIISEDSLIEDGTTMAAMLNVQSEWIPVRGLAADAVYPEQTPSIVGEILPVIQHVQQATAMRSGIAPENNVDANVLQQSTVGAFMGAMEKAGERIELIARLMAETGFKQLFRKVHQLCRMFPDMTTTVKLRGEWITVDPQGWEDRTDMTVNVGLGFNNKQQQVGLVTQLLTMQKEAQAMGLADADNMYNALEKLVEMTGIGAVEQFFKDPKAPGWQPPQPQPDPAMILAQAQAEALGKQTMRDDFTAQAKVQGDGQKMQHESTKSILDMQAKSQDMALRERELILRERELAQKDRELAVREAEAEAGITNVNSDTKLKDAMTLKTVADAGKSAADIKRTQMETSDEVREARDIIHEQSKGTTGAGPNNGGPQGNPSASANKRTG